MFIIFFFTITCLINFVFFFFKQKTAYEMELRLEFRRVLFRSDACRPRDARARYADSYPRTRRLAERKLIGWRVSPSITRSVRISPITLENLKPWPEHADATTTCGSSA